MLEPIGQQKCPIFLRALALRLFRQMLSSKQE